MSPRVAFLPHNAQGRDLIIGDLHGCLDDLLRLLDQLRFDPAVDRVMSTGDLVDRGPSSLACLRLICEPWFHAVIGNHEQMLLDAIANPDSERRLFHHLNGGAWAQQLIDGRDVELLRLADMTAGLPHVLVVGREGGGRYHLVHAHLLASVEPLRLWRDVDIDDGLLGETPNQTDMLIWARALAPEAGFAAMGDDAPTFYPGLSLTYCGHNPVPHPVTVLSHRFLDTGAGYAGNVWVESEDAGVPMHLSLLERQPDGSETLHSACFLTNPAG